jgi:hypothetical protein
MKYDTAERNHGMLSVTEDLPLVALFDFPLPSSS